MTKYEPQFVHGERASVIPSVEKQQLGGTALVHNRLYTRYVQELPPCRPSRRHFCVVDDGMRRRRRGDKNFRLSPSKLEASSYNRNRLRHTRTRTICAPKGIEKKKKKNNLHCEKREEMVPYNNGCPQLRKQKTTTETQSNATLFKKCSEYTSL